MTLQLLTIGDQKRPNLTIKLKDLKNLIYLPLQMKKLISDTGQVLWIIYYHDVTGSFKKERQLIEMVDHVIDLFGFVLRFEVRYFAADVYVCKCV